MRCARGRRCRTRSGCVVKSTIPPAPAGSGVVRMRANLNTNHKRVGHVQINGIVYTVTQGGGS